MRSTMAAMAALHSASEKKVCRAQPAQDVALGEADAGLDLGLVARLARPGRQDADAVVRGHHRRSCG